MLYEVETREIYRMTRAHDIFSGLGESEPRAADLKDGTSEQDELAIDDISKEEIVAGSYEGIKVV